MGNGMLANGGVEGTVGSAGSNLARVDQVPHGLKTGEVNSECLKQVVRSESIFALYPRVHDIRTQL